ncbi:hypothetical protein M9M90_01150 [Phenylobacterium sp. LH3H17]|uniref:hypothetical protein n=1 Tax=Phenylobacterium sp. LH3H17 TaxID=2903901 RepID=UPI0020CA1A30|nr:hypothetical protein [Phenylobacterium sp. LH3H17]UTP39811.1 hypothetical protein M9M90_01150 [Phenylobacterium sp. LH3H17]
MVVSIDQQLLPIFSFAAGFAAKWLADWQQSSRQTRREREARLDARRDRLEQEQISFQRQTLLAAQESSARLMRGMGKAHHADIIAFRLSGKWKKNYLPEGDAEAIRQGIEDIIKYSVRIRDVEARGLLDRFREGSNYVEFVEGPDEADQALLSMSKLYEAVNARIGHVLRSLDDHDLLGVAGK